MTENPAAHHEEPIASLLAVLDDPSEGRRRLPRLVGLLDADEETVRIGAAWATCHVVTHCSDTAAYLTRRLADRLADGEATLEAELAFRFIAARYPDIVDDELDAMERETDFRSRFRSPKGTLARANYHLPGTDRRDVGRTQSPGEDGSDGRQRASSTDGVERDHLDTTHARDHVGGSSDDEQSVREERIDDSSGDEAGSGDGTDDDGETAVSEGRAGRQSWEPADELPAIVYQSRFDQLTVLATRRRGRYADVYRTLGVIDGEQLPVGVALYHRPSERHEEFTDEMNDQLGRWAGVCDHDNVVTLHDWGVDPRLWAATEYTGQRLVDRERLAPDEALWNARELAAALEHVHENGVVHGGIDPGNVVYYGNVIDEDERQRPLLTNVGLLHVVRRYFDPTTRLDPRYAAPEYFDQRFGRIDHATDIYQLGAVLYLLFTGRPPYDGDYERIRDGVIADPPPRPGDVADVPPEIDDVVTKAMAREKLRRYETVTHLEQELRGIGADMEGYDG